MGGSLASSPDTSRSQAKSSIDPPNTEGLAAISSFLPGIVNFLVQAATLNERLITVREALCCLRGSMPRIRFHHHLFTILALGMLLVACGRSELVTTFPEAGVDGEAGIIDGGPDADAGPIDGGPDADAGFECEGAEDCGETGSTCRSFVCIDNRCLIEPVDCGDDLFCSIEQCVEGVGCEYVYDSSLCEDGEICIAVNGCVPAAECKGPEECDDNLVCNGIEECLLGPDGSGVCVPSPIVPCDDGDLCTMDFCSEVSGGCVFQLADRDNDGYLPSECGGDDCDDRDERVNPDAPELCMDQIDNNCDDLTDCEDDMCAELPVCCVPDEGGEGALGTCEDGGDNDCDGLVDCDDPDCAMALSCVCEPAEICGDGRDNDCNGLTDCLDPACVDFDECACVPEVDQEGQSEALCSDGLDNDCNGQTDCEQPACQRFDVCAMCAPNETGLCTDGKDNDCDQLVDCDDPNCDDDDACQVCARFETCRNGQDDNCNNLVDCDDPECTNNIECQFCLPFEICTDGIDDDCNGLADCDDPACVNEPSCEMCNVEACRNGLDDDCDGILDCDDPDCIGDILCSFCLPIELCQTGFDEDCDGLIDCDDPECANQEVCRVCEAFEAVCDDGQDEDCDQLVDCDDPDCAGALGCEMMCIDTREIGIAKCTDGLDSDCDGRSDCDDPDCSPFGSNGECCDGIDNDGNGMTDILTCRCETDSDCVGVGSLEQVCWTELFSVCGPRCDFLGGDSFCNRILADTRCVTSGPQTGECVLR